MSFLKLTEQNLRGKTVLIRADLNVPIKDGKIGDDTRIRASLASVRHCLENGAAVILMSHLGPPRASSSPKTTSRPWPRIWAACSASPCP